MGLYKKNSRWYMAFSVGGRQYNRSTGTSNKRVAKRVLDKVRAQVVEGKFGLIRSEAPKLNDWADQFLDSVQHANTRRAYSSCVVALKNFFGDARLSYISASRIEEFKKARLKQGTGPATINRSLSVLRRMMKLAVRQKLIAQSPLSEIDFLDERRCRREAHAFTPLEEQQILAKAQGYLRPLYILLVDGGLRTGEALAIKWEHLDFIEGITDVRGTKSPAARRTVPMTKRLKKELLRWRNLTGPATSEFVFYHPLNPAKHLLKVPKSWASLLKNAGVTYTRLYDSRATFSSRMNAVGVSPIFTDHMMGHAGGLAHVYAKANTEFKRDAIQKLDGYITAEAKKLELAALVIPQANSRPN